MISRLRLPGTSFVYNTPSPRMDRQGKRFVITYDRPVDQALVTPGNHHTYSRSQHAPAQRAPT